MRVYHGCVGALSPAGEVNDLASIFCVYRQRHVDVSNKSNAALEGELSTKTIYRPQEEKKQKTVIWGELWD